MESEDPNLVLREIGVWAGWEQAGSANTRSFLLDLLKDEGAHDNFLLREAGPGEYITYNSGSALWGNQRSAFA